MSSVELVYAGPYRSTLTGLELPSPPPTRIYISGYEYKIGAPKIPLPPLINAVKLIFNWVSTAGRVAKNIMYVLTGGGFVTSDPTKLKALANNAMGYATGAGSIAPIISSQWTLNSVTAKDIGGTSAQAVSDAAAVPGSVAAAPLPPGDAVCISWQIAASYRGGKPRTYLPGIPTTALVSAAGSQLTTTYAASVVTAGATFMASMNASTVTGGGTFQLGTVSYHHGHAVRPTPIFEQFQAAHCHERLDHQRRRSGKEVAFPVI